MGWVISSVGEEFPEKYHTVAEVNAELDSLATEYPEIIHIDTLGYTTRYGYPVLYAKVSDNPGEDEDEPAVLLHGAMHSDEILSVELLMHFLDTLAIRYAANDTTALRWINNLEVYYIPILNVEGHLMVESGITWWRKTCRDNNLNGVFDTLIDGVDLNRNYPLGWGAAPPDTSDFFYRGPWPFSETENQAIRELSYRKKFVIAVDYHSPTYGRGEVIYYPWQRSEMGGESVDLPVLREIARGMALSILKDNGINPYDYVLGGSGDGYHRTWQYNRFATVAFTCEVSDTTIQDTSMVDMICKHHVPGIEYLLNRALGPGVTGIVTDSETGDPVFAEVKVLQAYHPNMARRYTIPETGRYRRLLLPGIYTLEFSAEGYRTRRFYNFNVHGGNTTVFDVQLEAGQVYTDIEDVQEFYLPDRFLLHQNYPNPFNAGTRIDFTVGPPDYNADAKSDYDTGLEIFDIRGARVRTLLKTNLATGQYSIEFDGTDRYGNSLPSGVYFYRLTVENHSESRKMMLLK
jgi:carboxypeptidase T